LIRFMFFQHKVDHSRQLVGSRRDRHGGAMSAADAPKKCAQGAITVLQTSSGNAQSGRSPVLGRLHPSLFHFAASDAIIWAQVQPLSLIHISEPTRLGMISYAVFCLKKK